MHSIDLRSDTVTHPTPAMRKAIAEADVGDDVKRDDPTVNRLEAMAAERLGKEAALLVTSGTQGNTTSILTHCGRGEELICGQVAHIFKYETGGAAALGGVHPHTIPVQADGSLALADVKHAIRPDNVHYPITRLVCIENTQGSLGGVPLPVDYIHELGAFCQEHGLLLHMDGARVWNAAAATGTDIAEIVAPVDSVTFCLSKGLCAPVGSIICGEQGFIERARRTRKMLGGGMRQAGILAAAGIVALEEMTERLHIDHANAQRLAEGLTAIDEITVDIWPQTNMVFFSLNESVPLDSAAFGEALTREHNVKLDTLYGKAFRAVTHYWITEARIDRAVEAIKQTLRVTA